MSSLENGENGGCKICGKPLHKKGLTYCSRGCFIQSSRTGEWKACETCGKPIYVKPADKTKKYCSIPCKQYPEKLQGPGSKYVGSNGYVYVYHPTHPNASKSYQVLEHRLVMEQAIGRYLTRGEHVHHKNGVKTDNRLENLELVKAGDHARISVAQGVKKRRSMREELEEYRRRYGPLE